MTGSEAYDALLALAEAAPVFKPPAAAADSGDTPAPSNGEPAGDAPGVDARICESIGLTVIGETPDRAIRLWCDQTKKGDVIPSISRLTYSDLLQICGERVRERVHEGNDGDVPNLVHVRKVQHAIAVEASKRRLSSDTAKGRGVWPGDDNTVIVVGRGEAALWDGSTLSRVTRPVAAGQLLDLSGRRWGFDFDQLADFIDRAANTAWCTEAIDAVIDLFARWAWREGAYVPTVLAGLIMATWTQSLWPWRPHFAVTGESNSGKSLLLLAAAGLLGDRQSVWMKATAAGIAQNVGSTSDPILIDEFEGDRHRRQILELLRTSGRGAAIPRGTSHLHGKTLALRHIVWTGAIEAGLARQPEWNRFIVAEAVIPPADRMGKLVLPPSAELHLMGLRLLAIAVRHVRAAIALQERLRQRGFPGHDQRAVESYAVPASLLAVASDRAGEDEAAGLLGSLLGGVNSRESASRLTDQEQLLSDILESIVDLAHSGRATVAQILDRPDDHPGGEVRLQSCGLTKLEWEPRRCFRSPWDEVPEEESGLFIATAAVSRHLLRGTSWADQQIDQILVRLSGAKRDRRRVAGKVSRGVTVPWAMIVKIQGKDDEM